MKMNNKDFAVFILTHGRPDNIKTLKTLEKGNYSGPVYYIVDNEDKTADKYIKNFGEENVKIFDKKALADQVDEGNNFDERRTITHARNACFKIAKELGIKYFIQLDDDYTAFHFRYINKKGDKLAFKSVDNLDKVFDLYLDFYKSTPFKSIAFAQGGDFLGGIGNPTAQKLPLLRKCMNSFFCSTEREFQFVGAMNEDVNTYTSLGHRGELFGTVPVCSLVQAATQSQNSGITDMYLKYGTYCKAFTTVMMHPSGVRVTMMHSNHIRIHHLIKWINTAPLIIREEHRKKPEGKQAIIIDEGTQLDLF
jgi:hypothetical protein